jgi:cell division protein FtsL
VRTRPSEEELQRNRAAVERNRERASRLNPALITFMVTMVIIMGVFLVEYLTLQSKVSSTLSEISTMETQLQTLKASNDETLSQIEASVNLDEIKYKAITELGMSYATDDQIIPFANDSSDYVHQVTEVGK